MELTAERFPLFKDELLLRTVYPHQRFLLREGGFKNLKIHVPTSGGKTLGALLFALRDTYRQPTTLIRAIFTYPTNLLSRDQFQNSILRALTEWVGADLRAVGGIDPIKRKFVRDPGSFEETVKRGAPTYVFALPARLGARDLYVTVLTGESLQHLFTQENIVELGRRKGTYLLAVLDVLNQRDHIVLCSPDLLGYVAQRCYSVSANFYNARWRDELEIKLGDHQVVIDEYHFYDPYTYLNLTNAVRKLGATQLLCLSATAKDAYFPDTEVLGIEALTRDVAGSSCGDRVASFPIDVRLRADEIRIEDAQVDETIYFYNSAITAHEVAQSLRAKGLTITEWTGIQKSVEAQARLAIATSAAEVGLDRPFRVVHTEFWGNDWEIPSLIQRIGRVGRSAQAGRSTANVWVSGREPKLLFDVLESRPVMSKGEFGDLLMHTYGERSPRLEDYVSFYLWDENRAKELRRFWQVPHEVKRLRFHFRPPNAQVVFDWNGTKFVYDWIPIANRYEVQQVLPVTDLPFWHEMGYSEWRVGSPRQKREYLQRYEGKRDRKHRHLFWSAN